MTQKQEETMQIFKNYFAHINRSGATELLQWIEGNGFFFVLAAEAVLFDQHIVVFG